MIERMTESEGRVLGYRVIGKVTKEDYDELSREVEALVAREGSLALLIDLEQFEGEGPGAWGADLKFGRTYRHDIERMAIVGDKRWERLMAKLAEPFFARESEFFAVEQRARAWEWLRGR